MAQYTVTHKCGHQQTHNITGPDTRYDSGITRREWIAQQRAANPCSDCRSKTLVEEGAERAAEAQAAGYPALTGSEKQIAWAEKIRPAEVATMDDQLAKFPADIAAEIAAVLVLVAHRQTKASWWIDHRDGCGFGALLRELTDGERAQIKAHQDSARARRA